MSSSAGRAPVRNLFLMIISEAEIGESLLDAIGCLLQQSNCHIVTDIIGDNIDCVHISQSNSKERTVSKSKKSDRA